VVFNTNIGDPLRIAPFKKRVPGPQGPLITDDRARACGAAPRFRLKNPRIKGSSMSLDKPSGAGFSRPRPICRRDVPELSRACVSPSRANPPTRAASPLNFINHRRLHVQFRLKRGNQRRTEDFRRSRKPRSFKCFEDGALISPEPLSRGITIAGPRRARTAASLGLG